MTCSLWLARCGARRARIFKTGPEMYITKRTQKQLAYTSQYDCIDISIHSPLKSKTDQPMEQSRRLCASLTISTLITSGQRLRGLGWGIGAVQRHCIATVKLIGTRGCACWSPNTRFSPQSGTAGAIIEQGLTLLQKPLHRHTGAVQDDDHRQQALLPLAPALLVLLLPLLLHAALLQVQKLLG